jgi:hypothetical protein
MFLYFIPIIISIIVFTITCVVIHYYEPEVKPDDFIGKRFIAETLIDEEGGIIYLNDKYVMAKTSMMSKTYRRRIRKGEPILVVGYSEKDELYLVERYI